MANFALTISIDQCRLLSFRPAGIVVDDVVQFEVAAQSLMVPTTICTSILVDTSVLDALEDALGAPKAVHPRQIVLVCGAYLEEQISLAVQYLLAVGYPVFLLRDLIVARNAQLSYVHDQRLTVAGAVATTLQQLKYEWAASEPDPIRKARLSELLVLDAQR